MHNIFACNGILFNHESPMWVKLLPKNCNGSLQNKKGIQKIYLGNLDAKVISHAKDYMYAVWKMMQRKLQRLYVIQLVFNIQ